MRTSLVVVLSVVVSALFAVGQLMVKRAVGFAAPGDGLVTLVLVCLKRWEFWAGGLRHGSRGHAVAESALVGQPELRLPSDRPDLRLRDGRRCLDARRTRQPGRHRRRHPGHRRRGVDRVARLAVPGAWERTVAEIRRDR